MVKLRDIRRVRFECLKGTPQEVAIPLIGKISALTRVDRVDGFKIGITNDPTRRFSAYGDDYEDMIVIYQTNSIDSVSFVETLLIEHNWEFADNEIGGGGGAIGDPPYFLYV